MNHLLLHLLSRDIAPALEGARIGTVRRLDPLVVIDLQGPSGPSHLVVVVANPGPFLWLSETDPLAPGGDAASRGRSKRRAARIGDLIMKRIDGAVIMGPIQPPRNRVLRLPLETEGEQRDLALYLYGSAAKVRVQTEDTIIESLDPEEAGTSVPHTFGRRSASIIDVDAVALAEALTTATAPHQAALGLERELFEAFGGVVERARPDGTARAGSDAGGERSTDKRPMRPPASMDASGFDAQALVEFRDGLVAGNMPFQLAGPGRLGRVIPVPPVQAGTAPTLLGPFDTAREACAAVGEAMLPLAHEAILSRTAAPLRRRLQAREKLVAQLRREAAAAERFEVDRSEADILAAYQTQVPPGAREVELPDLYNEGQTRRIKLDPALSVREQVARRYRRAAKRERSRTALATRINEVENEVINVAEALQAIAETDDVARGLSVIAATMKACGIRPPQSKPAAREAAGKQYRRFDLEHGWFVLVGRNDQENDEITFRVARPDDIWMHAQQVPGSHIVLKSLGKPGNPSDKILEIAAAIAAHYSKAKHAKLVPVIYTRRKYVRKFRGARPGQVTCEREKTIFAEPKLPA